MISLITKFKIPTLLGLSIIAVGIAAGMFLVLTDQTSLISQADPSTKPQNVTISNIEESQVVISWETAKDIASFIKYGESEASLKTALDDKDKTQPTKKQIHYITLTDLKPQTAYLFKIIPAQSSDDFKFQTAAQTTTQNGFAPVTGVVLDGENPLTEGIAYLSIAGATSQSALIKSQGNFLIPLAFMRKEDLSDIYKFQEGQIAKLIIISPKGQASALFKLKAEGTQLPSIKLGQNVDLSEEQNLTPPPISQSNRFDLNEDNLVNANDYSIILKNFGKNPQNRKADLNSDGVVDQKDLDLMNEQINKPFSL